VGVRAWLRLDSIERQFPLLACLLLGIALVTLAAASYREVSRTTRHAAEQRLERVTRDLAEMLERNVPQRLATLDTIAATPVLRDVITTATPARRAAALPTLRRAMPAGAASTRTAIVLLDAAQRRVAWTGDSTLLEDQPVTGAAGVSGFRIHRDSLVVYELRVPVPGEGGWLIDRRTLDPSPRTRDAYRSLIGSEATLLFGNAAGDVWTDLAGRAPGPPAEVVQAAAAREYLTSGGEWRLAAAAPVARTPWVIAVEIPRRVYAGPARAYLRRITLIAGALLLVTAAAAWLVSRRITVRLRRLTEAAEAIAAGHHAERVRVSGGGELGRLGASFNTMAERVERAVSELDHRVAERTAQLESTNQELEAFAYAVSHDLRAPLRSIDGFSQILLEDYLPKLDETARGHFSRVRSATQRMGELIDDLLSLSRISRGELKVVPVDLADVARGIATRLRSAHADRAVEFITPDHLAARADPRLMQVALENLLSNAWKFTAKHPRARIELGSRVESNGATTFFVRDDGAGFDMAYAGKLFGAFQRLHPTTEFEGTGIGLATVQRVMHRHGGRVWAEGALERGATFYFTLGNGEA
jgi:signal transduction histidine kinase